MSRFFSGKFDALTPYTPGEQPKGQTFIKLNTNESPFPPAPLAQQYAKKELDRLQLYSDPQCRDLNAMAAEKLGVGEDEILFTNGSDEVLNFAFMAFCDAAHPVVFPDITYGSILSLRSPMVFPTGRSLCRRIFPSGWRTIWA